ncbi:MAG: HD domain-containing protein [Candidatus Magasanikbacteria bacterium]
MSYTYNPIYTHFKGKKVSRVEYIERIVVETIIKSKMPDSDRSWGKVFEIKHSSSVIQIGRLLAQKRGLDEELVVVICALHDIFVDDSGRTTDHASKSAHMAEKILRKTKKFTEKEIKIIIKAVREHSDKHKISKDPYVEIIKDADVFDCGLYEGVHDAYVYEKSANICRTYFDRIKRVRKELGLPYDARWDKVEFIEQGKK